MAGQEYGDVIMGLVLASTQPSCQIIWSQETENERDARSGHGPMDTFILEIDVMRSEGIGKGATEGKGEEGNAL